MASSFDCAAMVQQASHRILPPVKHLALLDRFRVFQHFFPGCFFFNSIKRVFLFLIATKLQYALQMKISVTLLGILHLNVRVKPVWK